MKRVLVIAIVVGLAVPATDATDFVNEGFEGSSFPPARWDVKFEGTGSAIWYQEGGGPWGNYAAGGARSDQQGLVRATLMSYEFELKANTKVYYFFHYYFNGWGHSNPEADFYIAYVPPLSGNLVYLRLSPSSGWLPFPGSAVNTLNGRVKAYWRVWVVNYWRYAWASLRLDNVVISDEDPSAVAPASLGRVKALLR